MALASRLSLHGAGDAGGGGWPGVKAGVAQDGFELLGDRLRMVVGTEVGGGLFAHGFAHGRVAEGGSEATGEVVDVFGLEKPAAAAGEELGEAADRRGDHGHAGGHRFHGGQGAGFGDPAGRAYQVALVEHGDLLFQVDFAQNLHMHLGGQAGQQLPHGAEVGRIDDLPGDQQADRIGEGVGNPLHGTDQDVQTLYRPDHRKIADGRDARGLGFGPGVELDIDRCGNDFGLAGLEIQEDGGLFGGGATGAEDGAERLGVLADEFHALGSIGLGQADDEAVLAEEAADHGDRLVSAEQGGDRGEHGVGQDDDVGDDHIADVVGKAVELGGVGAVLALEDGEGHVAELGGAVSIIPRVAMVRRAEESRTGRAKRKVLARAGLWTRR